MAASILQLEAAVKELEQLLAVTSAELSRARVVLVRSINTRQSESVIAQQQAKVDQLEQTVAGLQNNLDTARQALEQGQEPGLLPPESKSAAQTVSDDNVSNPAKPPPLEVQGVAGVVTDRVPQTAPSNARPVPTGESGDTDINLNAPITRFDVSQAADIQTEIGAQPVPAVALPLTQNGGNIFNPAAGLSSGTKIAAAAAATAAVIAQAQIPTSRTTTPDLGIKRPATNQGVGQQDDNPTPTRNSTETTVNNSYNNSQIIQPQVNVLDQFASVTYSISVYLCSPEQYRTLINSKNRSVIGYNLLFQSAGAPANATDTAAQNSVGDIRTQAKRSPFFDVDFYIDNVSIKQKFPGKSTQSAHTMGEVKFTITEPNNISLIDRLYAAVQANSPTDSTGKVAYTAAQYLMVIRWYGWDINGNLITGIGGVSASDPNAAVEKFIPFKIREIKWAVSSKLVTYDFTCAAVGQITGSSTKRGTIPYDIELSDGTVRGLLTGDPEYTAAGQGSSNSGTPGTAPPAPGNASAAPTNRKIVRQGLMGAMNDFQTQLVRDGIYEKPDKYELVFASGAESIADALITHPDNTIVNQGSTPMLLPATRDPSVMNPKISRIDSSVRNFAVVAGQQIVQVIDLAIRNSTFITNQARVNQQEETEIYEDAAGNIVEIPKVKDPIATILWFNISMEATPLEYDFKRNDYAYSIKYIISPYVVQNFDSKYFPLPRFQGLHKSYKYWFTGENISVLDFQQTFNYLYNQTVSGSEPGNSATDQLRRQRTANMREIIPFVYQSRSQESSQGAEGKANEIGANAAEYLYSPKDLGTAKIKIIGDPGWIMQGSQGLGVYPSNFDYAGFLPDGTINFDARQVLFEIAWQRPRDYDLNSGIADPYRGLDDRQPLQSNVYFAKECVSEFRSGRFEQTLEGGLYLFPKPNQQNTAAGAATSSAPAATRLTRDTDRTAVVNPASGNSALNQTNSLLIPGSGAKIDPAAGVAVALPNTGTKPLLVTTDSLTRQINAGPTDSFGNPIGVNNLSRPAVIPPISDDSMFGVMPPATETFDSVNNNQLLAREP